MSERENEHGGKRRLGILSATYLSVAPPHSRALASRRHSLYGVYMPSLGTSKFKNFMFLREFPTTDSTVQTRQ